MQQISQVTGLLVIFAIITVLARRLSLAELGVYGLLELGGGLPADRPERRARAPRCATWRLPTRPSAADEAFSTAVVLLRGRGRCLRRAGGGAGSGGHGADRPAGRGRSDQARVGSLLLGA